MTGIHPFRVLRAKPLWIANGVITGVLALLFTVFYVGANIDPVDHLKNLPVGLVNTDKGAAVGGKKVNLGAQITESIKKSAASGGKIDWKTMDEKKVKEELGEGKLYGALVVPADFTASATTLTSTATTGTPARPTLTVLTNQSAGSLGSSLARSATTQAAESASLQVGKELTARAGQAKLPAAARVMLADPAAVTVKDGHPLASHSGLGLTAFYYALVLVVCGMLSANVISGQNKKDDDGLNVRTRIETIYAHRGFDSIDGSDLRGRMRWWGLYTQRRPGISGGKTAVLDPEELDDEFFMMRVRIDGGRLSLRQLRVVADISQEFARGTADITDRQNVQYHWIRVEDVPEIWRRLEGVGLSTTEACGDVPRVILGSPVAGIAKDEIIDGTPAIEEIHRRVIGNPAYSNLPRKFKTAVSGSPHMDVTHEINDVAFVGVDHPEYGPGFDVWVGGGLSTNPKIGVRLGAWVPLEDVADVHEGVVAIFRDYGYRRLRNRARLKYLVGDWGPEKFRQVLEEEYLLRKMADGPAPEKPVQEWRDHIGVHQQKDGNYYVGFAPRVGRIDGATLSKVADLAEAHGSDRVRTTAEQKMLILDVAGDQVASLTEGLEALDLTARPSVFRRGTMACTGIEFCKLAIVETKGRGSWLIDEMERRLPGFDQPVTINLNGCPNSCARIQTADIGLKGQLVTDSEGEQVEGYQVHLGGSLGLEPGFGRKVRGLKVTADDLPDYIERLLRAFEAQREEGERFAQWAARADEGDLK